MPELKARQLRQLVQASRFQANFADVAAPLLKWDNWALHNMLLVPLEIPTNSCFAQSKHTVLA